MKRRDFITLVGGAAAWPIAARAQQTRRMRRMKVGREYRVREDGEDWYVGLRCPCVCGQRLEMMLLKEVKLGLDLTPDPRGRAAPLRMLSI